MKKESEITKGYILFISVSIILMIPIFITEIILVFKNFSSIFLFLDSIMGSQFKTFSLMSTVIKFYTIFILFPITSYLFFLKIIFNPIYKFMSVHKNWNKLFYSILTNIKDVIIFTSLGLLGYLFATYLLNDSLLEIASAVTMFRLIFIVTMVTSFQYLPRLLQYIIFSKKKDFSCE